MGTSVSHRSPNTHNWRAVSAIYRSGSIPVGRAVQEIWRAATNQQTGDIAMKFTEPIIAKCLKTVMESSSQREVASEIARLIAASGESNLATDIARRAAVNSFEGSENRRMQFVSSLFSQATDYLVSRDISGYVGIGERIQNVSSSIEFKDSIRNTVESIICNNPPKENLENNFSKWRNYIINQIHALSNKSVDK